MPLKGKAADCFSLCGRGGRENPAANPNGSLENIAGYAMKPATLGMMPHPSGPGKRPRFEDGLVIFRPCFNISISGEEQR